MNSSFEQLSVFGEVAEDLRIAIGELTQRDALGDGRLLHLQAVLVGAGQEVAPPCRRGAESAVVTSLAIIL